MSMEKQTKRIHKFMISLYYRFICVVSFNSMNDTNEVNKYENNSLSLQYIW